MDRIYKYNPNISYNPNGGRYLQLITAKNLYIQNITVAENDGHSDSFHVKFPNVFTNYPLGAVRVEDQKFKDWDHYKFTIWQLQLNFVVFCASSACGVSVEHLNAKEPMIRSIYRFHVYYHIRRILKILEIPLPYENSFNQYNNPYNHEKFIGICSEYGVSNDLTKWRKQKYFSTWQSRAWETGKPGMSNINENSFSRWIIEKSDGLTMLGLQKLSGSVRHDAYLILTSQTSTRGPIVGIESRNLDAQHTFLNTFENIVNRRVNISEDIRRFQKTLQYARSKVDYVIGEFIYMLPSNMNLQIEKVKDYNNKILISSPSFKIGTNLKINLDGEQVKLKDKPDVKSKEVEMVKTEPDVKPKVITKPDIKSNKEHKQDVKPNIELKHDVMLITTKPDTNKITYEEEKVALYWELQLYLQYGGCSSDLRSICLCHEICVYQDSNTCDKCPQILRQPTNCFLCSIQDP